MRCQCGRPTSTLREKLLTDDDTQRLADVAPPGYEPSRLRPLGGRPRMGPAWTEVVPVRLDTEVRAAVEARATGEHTSTSEIIREADSRSFTSPDPGRKTDGRNGKRTGNTGHFRSLQSPTVTQEIGSDQGRKPTSRHIRVGRKTVRFPPAPRKAPSTWGNRWKGRRDHSPVRQVDDQVGQRP